MPVHRLCAVVVVDNGSTDGTAQAAHAAGAVVVEESERGYGAACLAGIACLERLDPPPAVVVFLDADHAEHAEQLVALLGPVAEGADLVLGARTDPGGRTGNLRRHARWGNRAVLAVARILFGRSFRDLGPFRAIRFSALDRLGMDDRNWGWTLQMQIRAVRLGLSIVEVGVFHFPRSEGRSKISGRPWVSLNVGAAMLRTLARERLRAREGRQARQNDRSADPRPPTAPAKKSARRDPPARPPSPDGR